MAPTLPCHGPPPSEPKPTHGMISTEIGSYAVLDPMALGLFIPGRKISQGEATEGKRLPSSFPRCIHQEYQSLRNAATVRLPSEAQWLAHRHRLINCCSSRKHQKKENYSTCCRGFLVLAPRLFVLGRCFFQLSSTNASRNPTLFCYSVETSHDRTI